MARVNGSVVGEWSLRHVLEVEYTLVNSTKYPYVVFDPQPSYVLPREDGRLILALAWMPVPPDTEVEVVSKPPVVKVPALGELKQVAHIPLPIDQAPAYDTSDVNRPPVVRD